MDLCMDMRVGMHADMFTDVYGSLWKFMDRYGETVAWTEGVAGGSMAYLAKCSMDTLVPWTL